jgi:hypothetical protein
MSEHDVETSGIHKYILYNVHCAIVLRYTVGKITPIQKREVRASDFGPRASFWMNFPKEGSRLTPSHPAEDFKWKDYCPMVFRFVILLIACMRVCMYVCKCRNSKDTHESSLFSADSCGLLSLCIYLTLFIWTSKPPHNVSLIIIFKILTPLSAVFINYKIVLSFM